MRKSVIPSRMKYGVYRSPHIFYLTGVQGKFLASLEMTIPGKAVLSFSALETLSSSLFHTASALSAPSRHLPLEGKAMVRGGGILVSLPSPWGKRILNFSLLPLEGGAPKGRRLALAAG